jgi:hypothetical protein
MLRRTLAAAACAVLAAAPAHAQLFDFEGADSPVGTLTPLSLTRSGLTATFIGTPNAFSVVNTPTFSTLTGNYLAENDPNSNTLEIQFSSPVNSVSLLFGLDDPTNAATLTMNLFLGGVFVGSVNSSGAIPAGFTFPEGTLSFAGGPFDQLFLFGDAEDMAIDNLQIGPSVVPEPGAVVLVATGLLALGGAAMRRRNAA